MKLTLSLVLMINSARPLSPPLRSEPADGSGIVPHVVSADETSLIVLDLTYPGLPDAAARILRDMATKHPEYFTAVRAQVFVDRDLRVGPGGVLAADRKVESSTSTIVKGQASECREARKSPSA